MNTNEHFGAHDTGPQDNTQTGKVVPLRRRARHSTRCRPPIWHRPARFAAKDKCARRSAGLGRAPSRRGALPVAVPPGCVGTEVSSIQCSSDRAGRAYISAMQLNMSEASPIR